jgi:hypothetical protein
MSFKETSRNDNLFRRTQFDKQRKLAGIILVAISSFCIPVIEELLDKAPYRKFPTGQFREWPFSQAFHRNL